MNVPLIAIDGPAGCGKSTVADALARELSGVMFSSGLIYRGATYAALEGGIDLQDPSALLKLLSREPLDVVRDGLELRVHVDGVDPGAALHSRRVTAEIHWLADDPEVRDRLLPLQRELIRRDFACAGPIVVEGRDIGTVVFPDATLKVFLTATVDERARRRVEQLRREQGDEVAFEDVRSEVEQRDRFDRERAVAPLLAADDARTVDTTGIDTEEVLRRILAGTEWERPADWRWKPGAR